MLRTLRYRSLTLVSLAGILLSTACQPAAPSPTSPPAATVAKPAESPAAKPAAGSPAAAAASPAAASPAAKPSDAPKPVAKLPDFPTKPIDIIVPFGAGGGFDAVARQIAIPMQRDLGQPVVVKNVTGGGQRIGARTFQQAPPDGHTIGYFSELPLYVSTFVEEAEGFDITKWISVAGVRKAPYLIMVGKDSPIKSVQDIVDADQRGQRLRLPTEGIGGHTPGHVIMIEALGLKNVVHVGGFQGTADIAPSLIRGDTDLVLSSPVTSWLSFIQSGDIRPIALIGQQRNPLIPNTPTAREAGMPNVADVEAALDTVIYGITTIPGTPPERVQVMENAVLNALKDPEFLTWAKGAGVDTDLVGLNARDFSAMKQRNIEALSKYVEPIRKATQGT